MIPTAIPTSTPLPWTQGGTFNPDSARPSCNIWGPTPEGRQSGAIVAKDLTIPDAHRVLRAVSNHALMLEALETIEDILFNTDTNSDLSDVASRCYAIVTSVLSVARR